MAGWKPLGSIYDTIRKRWFGPGDVFHKGDWLPRLYSREFEHTDEAPNVPEQASIPTPPPPSGGGADPRVDQLLKDVADLKASPPGSSQDPRVEGLLNRVTAVEGKAASNADGLVSVRQEASEAKAVADGLASGVAQATAKAQEATDAASEAAGKATQVADAVNQAKLKAEDASAAAMAATKSVQGLQSKVQSAEATATRAETKASEAASTASAAQVSATNASSGLADVKAITDKLAPLGLDQTYNETRANARLAKEGADNAQIIAQGVGDKVDVLEAWKTQMPEASRILGAVTKINGYPDASIVTTNIEQFAQVQDDAKKAKRAVDAIAAKVGSGIPLAPIAPIEVGNGGMTVIDQAMLTGVCVITNTTSAEVSPLLFNVGGGVTRKNVKLSPGNSLLIVGDGERSIALCQGQSSGYASWADVTSFSGDLRFSDGPITMVKLASKL